MRVIEAISDMNIGGAGRLLLMRLKSSTARDIQYTVILPKNSMLVKKFSDIGVRIYTVKGCIDKSWDLGAVFEICKIIKYEKPDVLNAHACLSARIAAFLCGVRVKVYTRHCAYPVSKVYKIFPVKQLSGAFNSMISDKIIAVAEAARDNLICMGIPKNKTVVIINGVEGFRNYSSNEKKKLRQSMGIPYNSFVAGICARVEKCKDHETFLRAARILCREDERYHFLVVGGGSLLKDMKKLSEALGISERVTFTGFCDNVESCFNIFDLNVNCSVGTETSSLALSEGMSLSLPSVASSYGGNMHMVHHGENGFIYPQRDFCTLADAIRLIASSRELYEYMSKRAYERYLKEFNAKEMTYKTEELYRKLYLIKNIPVTNE